MGLGTRLDEAGWRQGRIVELADHTRFAEFLPALNDGDRLIVISHSCDVVREPDESEPLVELILSRKIENLGGNFTHNKNPRELHLALQTTTGDYPVSLIQCEKLSIPRKLFDGLMPARDLFLDRGQAADMARWLASRYQRPAFPNAFNTRIAEIAKAHKKLRGAAKKISPVVSGVFVQVLPFRELEDGENYSVNLLALIPSGQGIDKDSTEITDPVNAIAEIMKTANMEVKWVVRKEDTVPYSLFRTDFKSWPFDDISLRANPHHETP